MAFRSTENLDIEDAVAERLRIILKEGLNIPADEEKDELELPPYYDPQKFKLAQITFYNNLFTMMIAKLSGLLTLLAIPSILEILVFTKQSGTPCTAFRRYLSTILHTFVWYESEPQKQEDFFRSLKTVRRKHCLVSRRCSKGGLRRITQRDMAITQFGFIGFTLLSAEELGIKASEEEFDSLVHFWRVIGHMLGMQDKYNLCSGTVAECRTLCRGLLDDIFIPVLEKENKEFEQMAHILIEGLWPIIAFLEPKAYLAFTLQLATSATTNNNHSVTNDTASLPLKSKILFNLQINVHKYLLQTRYWWSAIFRFCYNNLTRFAMFLTENFPFLAYLIFGKKQSNVNIYKIHYE
ncbi:uncharacterized protein LOC117179701 [Belonocnema kinseyi]|uniref:uncharacterized protein LOC117179701 n=1 Tax=Belonocnema kinseyi TaxID=2817044 RepID=UPI00143D9759|nr:uncharacterized protein LOC117179701 [Belonocnema kinseyi]XP_033227619.1 uncharacterized protein LOC117179701 [Belonocnema kinseyi]